MKEILFNQRILHRIRSYLKCYDWLFLNYIKNISHIEQVFHILRVRGIVQAIRPCFLTSKLPVLSLVTSREIPGRRRVYSTFPCQ
jgi:hypothetical protein